MLSIRRIAGLCGVYLSYTVYISAVDLINWISLLFIPFLALNALVHFYLRRCKCLFFYCFFYYSICLLLKNEDLLLAAYCPHFGVSPSESNSEGFFFELPSCGATQRSQKKKCFVKEAGRLNFAPTRAENRPEFGAAAVKDRTGYEKVWVYFTWKSSLTTYTYNPEVTAPAQALSFEAVKALWEM